MQRYKPPMLFSTQKLASMHDDHDGEYVLHTEAQAEITLLQAQLSAEKALADWLYDSITLDGLVEDDALQARAAYRKARGL